MKENCFGPYTEFPLSTTTITAYLYQSHKLAKLHVDRLHIAPVSRLQSPDQSIEAGESVAKERCSNRSCRPDCFVGILELFFFSSATDCCGLICKERKLARRREKSFIFGQFLARSP